MSFTVGPSASDRYTFESVVAPDSDCQCGLFDEILEKMSRLGLELGGERASAAIQPKCKREVTKAGPLEEVQTLQPLFVRDVGGRKGVDLQLKDDAVKAFARYKVVWNDVTDLWMRANTCDACLSLTSALIECWPDDAAVIQIKHDVKDMLELNLAVFALSDNQQLWADDFGWCGLLGLNAHKFLTMMGEEKLAQGYLKFAVDHAWKRMHSCYDASSDAWPIPHGCRNGLPAASLPDSGVKNTVVNALFFLLSVRIYRLYNEMGHEDKDQYLEMAYKQWSWFSGWFDPFGYIPYLKSIEKGAGLVQERPLYFDEKSDCQYLVHPDWKQGWGWVWSGDQGLILAALTEMLAIKDDLAKYLKRAHPHSHFHEAKFEKEVKRYISTIGHGIKKGLVGSTDHIIREAPCSPSFELPYSIDYVCGRGVLARCLDAEKLTLLGDELTATAKALWSSRDAKTDQVQPCFTSKKDDEAYVRQFRSLWGMADDATDWQIAATDKRLPGVCQALGMDILGAAIRSKHASQKMTATADDQKSRARDHFDAWCFSCLL